MERKPGLRQRDFRRSVAILPALDQQRPLFNSNSQNCPHEPEKQKCPTERECEDSSCAWRINRIKRLSEFGTSPGSATATGTNRGQLVIQLLPQAIPAGALPALHAF